MSNKYETFEQVCQRMVFEQFGEMIFLEWFEQFNNTQDALKMAGMIINLNRAIEQDAKINGGKHE